MSRWPSELGGLERRSRTRLAHGPREASSTADAGAGEQHGQQIPPPAGFSVLERQHEARARLTSAPTVAAAEREVRSRRAAARAWRLRPPRVRERPCSAMPAASVAPSTNSSPSAFAYPIGFASWYPDDGS